MRRGAHPPAGNSGRGHCPGHFSSLRLLLFSICFSAIYATTVRGQPSSDRAVGGQPKSGEGTRETASGVGEGAGESRRGRQQTRDRRTREDTHLESGREPEMGIQCTYMQELSNPSLTGTSVVCYVSPPIQRSLPLLKS